MCSGSEVVDGQGDVHAASVVEVDEVEVEEKFGGSVVELSLIHISLLYFFILIIFIQPFGVNTK